MSGNATRALPLAAGQATSGVGEYCGMVVDETSGTASAKVRVWDGTAAGGTSVLLDVVNLPEADSADSTSPRGVWVTTGIFVEIVSGSVQGSIRIA